MENIGIKWRDKEGKVVVDMPVAAAFICTEYPGSFQVKLVSVEHKSTQDHGDERVPGTGLTIVIEGGKVEISNKSILQHLMTSSAFVDGTIRIDPEDPTGFWTMQGVLTPETKQVLIAPQNVRNPHWEDLKKIGSMKAPEEATVKLVLDKA